MIDYSEATVQKKITQTIVYAVAAYALVLLLGVMMYSWKMPSLGLLFLQLTTMSLFLFLYLFLVNCSVNTIKKAVFSFHFLGIIVFYLLYLLEYQNPLGYLPADAYTYNKYAILGQNMNLPEYLQRLFTDRGYNYSDWGFFVFLKYVYALPGNDILTMKFINALLSYYTAIMIYKISLLIANPFIARNVLILFGLSPIILFFGSSGLKEVLFLFVIAVAFYQMYQYALSKKQSSLLLAIVFAVLIIFFRPLLFVAFVFGWVVYFFFKGKGQYAFIYRMLMIVFTLLISYVIFRMLQDEINFYIALNQNAEAVAGERLHSATGNVDSSQFDLVNRFIGFFGPLPTILQLGEKDIEILQSMGVILKAFLSVLNLYFMGMVILKRYREFYPICIFIFFTILMMVFSSSSFDMRFHYTYYPFFILTSVCGAYLMVKNKKFWMATSYYILLFFVVFLWNRRG